MAPKMPEVVKARISLLEQYPDGPGGAAGMMARIDDAACEETRLADAFYAHHDAAYPDDPSYPSLVAVVRQRAAELQRPVQVGIMATGQLGRRLQADADWPADGYSVILIQGDLVPYPRAGVARVEANNSFPAASVRPCSLDVGLFRMSGYNAASLWAQLRAVTEAVKPGGVISLCPGAGAAVSLRRRAAALAAERAVERASGHPVRPGPRHAGGLYAGAY
jgi:hypothetical protein